MAHRVKIRGQVNSGMRLKKRIYKGTFMVFADFMLLSVCCILITTNLYTKAQTEKISRGFYSEHVLSLSVADSREGAAVSLPELSERGILYKTGLSLEYDLRGVLLAGEEELPPLLSGRFFDSPESRGNEKIAVVGSQCLEQSWKKDGKDWIEIQGEIFQVIGVMGTEEKNRFQTMVWIPFGTAVEIWGVDGTYRLDGKEKEAVDKNAEYLEQEMAEYSAVTIEESVGKEISGVGEKLNLGTNRLIRMVYLAMVIGFLLAGILCISYWSGFQKKKMEIRFLLGESDSGIWIHLNGYLLRAAAAALLAGIFISLALYWGGIVRNLRAQDLVLSSVVTSGTAGVIGGVETAWLLWKKQKGR